MKRGTAAHPKTCQLADMLGCPGDNAKAAGTLAALWDFASQYAPQGDIGKFTDEYIARACYWAGDPVCLIRALETCVLIERTERARLVIHDWPEHCEDTVHNHLARKRLFFWDGTAPKFSRLPSDDRKQAEAFYAENKGLSENTHGTCARKIHTENTHAESARSARDPYTYTNTYNNTNTDPPNPPSGEAPIGAVSAEHQLADVGKQIAENPPQATPATLPGMDPPETPVAAPVPVSVNAVGFQIWAAWNEMAAGAGLPKCEAMSKKRHAHIAARCKDDYFVANWRSAIAKIPDIPWMLGNNSHQWKASIDYFLKPDSVAKIMEAAPFERTDLTTDEIGW